MTEFQHVLGELAVISVRRRSVFNGRCRETYVTTRIYQAHCPLATHSTERNTELLHTAPWRLHNTRV
jgi:hypothetical protein